MYKSLRARHSPSTFYTYVLIIQSSQQPITPGDTCCTDRLSNLPKVTQLVSSKISQAIAKS